MRFKGTIAEWNDDRGFGFIKPAEGGDRGRPQARQVRYPSAARRPVVNHAQPSSAAQLKVAIAGSSVFLMVVTVLVVMRGGGPAAYFAQYAWRHKSRKESFRAMFHVAVVLNLVALTVFVLSGGDVLSLLPR